MDAFDGNQEVYFQLFAEIMHFLSIKADFYSAQ